jgi:hypothetical protein
MLPTFDPTIPAGQPQTVIVGRWPTNANKCTFDAAGNPRQTERDSFDYLQNAQRDLFTGPQRTPPLPDIEDNKLYFELDLVVPFQAGNATTHQQQRGFSWGGQHIIPNTGNKCVGSEWDIARVQKIVNLPNYSLISGQRQFLPNQGVVLVEVFWQHSLLLRNPVFNPVYTILGNQTTLSVWSMFPVPAVEPRIRYQ